MSNARKSLRLQQSSALRNDIAKLKQCCRIASIKIRLCSALQPQAQLKLSTSLKFPCIIHTCILVYSAKNGSEALQEWLQHGKLFRSAPIQLFEAHGRKQVRCDSNWCTSLIGTSSVAGRRRNELPKRPTAIARAK